MKAITARNPHDSLSFSRRYFNFKKKPIEDEEDDDMESILTFNSTKSEDQNFTFNHQPALKRSHSTNSSPNPVQPRPSKPPTRTIAKPFSKPFAKLIKSSLSLTKPSPKTLIGTIFGHRRGHVNLAFQEDFKKAPSFLVQLATPTSVLVKEMASGLVRIALECDKKFEKRGGFKLLEEPIWRAYCNGRKCGHGTRRACGVEEWEVLNSVGKISFGAGVIPGAGNDVDGDEGGEVMYMRAKFERVVGSRDSEAFYMVSPDHHHGHGGGGGGGPELSIYLLRV